MDYRELLFAVILLLSGVFAAQLCLAIYKKMPTASFCDYGELPLEQTLLKLDKIKKARFFSVKSILTGLCFGVVFILLYKQLSFSLEFFGVALCVIPLWLLCVSDISFYIIPDSLVLSCAVMPVMTAVSAIFFNGNEFYQSWYSPLLCALTGGGFWLVLELAGRFIYKKEAIGGGDMKLSFLLCLGLSLKLGIIMLFITIFLAGGAAIVMLLQKKLEKDQYIPLAPFIGTAFLIICCFKEQILFIVDNYFLF